MLKYLTLLIFRRLKPASTNFQFLISYFLFLLFLLGISALSSAQEMGVSIFEKQDRFKKDVEEKIKSEILDPILGPGRSFVFADIEFEVISRKAEQSKGGMGVVQEYKESGEKTKEFGADYILPGIPKPKSILGPDNTRPEAARGLQTQQAKGSEEVRYGIELKINRFQVTVAHDIEVSSESIKLARDRIEEFLLPYKINEKDPPTVTFKPTKFHSASTVHNFIDDLKRPGVYLPLLYALLLLLVLMFLFGPLWGFFRGYVSALVQKPGAEVNIESKTEFPEGAGGGGGAGKSEGSMEGHQAIDLKFEQSQGDELMQKFNPFTYINEENLKKLVYMFLMKKEDPWVIAIVLSYLKPELSRKALSMLPFELQSKIAIESIAVKQATREQIKAIDKEIRENVDFVVGGIERLSKMLEECDLNTKKNILEYLKTQKPEIYEKVKNFILMFEDMVKFSDRDMQTIIRSVTNEDIAKAIHDVDPAITNKFFSNMSEGAVKTIKEIMEYSTQLTPQQIDDAQMKILDTIKTLETEGKISSRQQGSQGLYIIDADEIGYDSERKEKFKSITEKKEEEKPEVNSEQATQYFQAGLDLFNQARLDESIPYFQYALSLDPSMSQAHQYLGNIYYSLGRIDESISSYEQYASLSNDPAVSEWLNNFKQQVGK